VIIIIIIIIEENDFDKKKLLFKTNHSSNCVIGKRLETSKYKKNKLLS
jgi:hypothetical protein